MRHYSKIFAFWSSGYKQLIKKRCDFCETKLVSKSEGFAICSVKKFI